MYQRIPQAGVFTRDTLPERFTNELESESDTWINYRVHRGMVLLQVDKGKDEEPSQHVLDEYNYGLVKPLQKHAIVHLSEDALIHMELLTRQSG